MRKRTSVPRRAAAPQAARVLERAQQAAASRARYGGGSEGGIGSAAAIERARAALPAPQLLAFRDGVSQSGGAGESSSSRYRSGGARRACVCVCGVA